MEDISNRDDTIDSRDVIKRIDDLEDMLDDESLDAEDREEMEAELRALRDLAKEGEEASEDWQYGATLVRDGYFARYAQELAEDIGAVTRDMQWPLNCIDWEQAAIELQQNYTEVEFDGKTYWAR